MCGKLTSQMKKVFKVKSVIKISELSSFIERLPQKSKTVVGTDGIKLSGGQKQRIGIARALINSPDIILADEPTGALDSTTSMEVMALIQKINNEGKTILVVTHEHDIAMMCKRVVNLKDGVIVEDKKVKQNIIKNV